MQNACNRWRCNTHTHTHTICLQDRKNLKILGLICIAPKINIREKVDMQLKYIQNVF